MLAFADQGDQFGIDAIHFLGGTGLGGCLERLLGGLDAAGESIQLEASDAVAPLLLHLGLGKSLHGAGRYQLRDGRIFDAGHQ